MEHDGKREGEEDDAEEGGGAVDVDSLQAVLEALILDEDAWQALKPWSQYRFDAGYGERGEDGLLRGSVYGYCRVEKTAAFLRRGMITAETAAAVGPSMREVRVQRIMHVLDLATGEYVRPRSACNRLSSACAALSRRHRGVVFYVESVVNLEWEARLRAEGGVWGTNVYTEDSYFFQG